jgi:stearoyl-CoA desaturase (delta-9 desaturase)
VLFVILFFVLHWYLSLFSQTFFQHRYAAHKSFDMSHGWERFFFFFAWLTQGSSYLSPRAYGIMHRIHHAYTDTELDPHSPSYDKNLFAMMWRTKNIYSDILYERTEIEPRFTKNVPAWKSFDLFASSGFPCILDCHYITLYLLFAPQPGS